MTAVADTRDVILRDGTTLRLRPPTSADEDAVLAFFSALSPRSLFLRFHGLPAIDPRLVRSFLDPDWRERGALVGTHVSEGGERIVALASYARLRAPTAAEAAFAVADDFQERGVGTRMLEQLAARAADMGIERFVAEVAAENVRMLGVFADAGFEETSRREGEEVIVELAIRASPGYLAEVDRRDHVAVTASLRPFFAPARAGRRERRGRSASADGGEESRPSGGPA